MDSPQSLQPPPVDAWSPVSSTTTATLDGRCLTPGTPNSLSASLSSAAGSGASPASGSGSVSGGGGAASNYGTVGSDPRLSQSRSPAPPPRPPAPRPPFAMPGLTRNRKQNGPTEIEKHKDEIIGMYAASTNKSIRNMLQSKYGIKITEKQLKRVLRVWKAYKNDRGIRKATIAREHNRPPRGSRGQRGRRAKNKVPRPPRPIERTPSNDSDDDSEIEEIYRSDHDDTSSSIVDYNNVQNAAQPGLTVPRVHVQVSAPSSPGLSFRGPGPSLHIPVSSPTMQFAPGNIDGFSFNTSPHMPTMPSPILPFSSTPPFPSMTPSSPSGSLRNHRDRIAQLFMEAVTRFPTVYKFQPAPNSNHWNVYRKLQNVHEQRLRQGVLIAQQNEDFELLDETLTTHIVPMYEKLDLLAIVGIVATFAALKSQKVIGALIYHLRFNISKVPERHRPNMVAVLNCFRDLLIRHNGDAELFHEDLQSALSCLPVFIQQSLGRQSLVGIHLIFLLNLGDTNEIVQEAAAGNSSKDPMLRLATNYLLSGKLFFTEGVSNPQTRHHVAQCYKIAARLKKMMDNQGIGEDDERKQDLYHYLCRVGMWHVQCLNRQRLQDGEYGAEPGPPVALLEESILYGELCAEDGPQSPIVIQAMGKLARMYADMGDYWKAEMTGLRLGAVNDIRQARKQGPK